VTRTALVTGASSGIGRALVERLGKDGMHVALAARRADLLDEVKGVIEKNGGRAVALPADLTDDAQAVEVVARAERALGGLDMVVACAGMAVHGAATTVTWDAIAPVLRLNVLGAIATLTAAIPGMMAKKSGQLVGISSLAGYRGLPANATYCASKAALSTFLEGLRIDLAGTGIAVSDVRPGFVRTEPGVPRPSPSISLEECTDEIVAAIAARRAVAEFPKSLAWVLAATRLMPNVVYDALVRRSGR
jgi:short-subunit dehydrogenase